MLKRKDFEDLGCKFVLCSDCETYDFTFNYDSKKEDWVYVIVWQPNEDKVVICHHIIGRLPYLFEPIEEVNKYFERLFFGIIKDAKYLNVIIDSVIKLNG